MLECLLELIWGWFQGNDAAIEEIIKSSEEASKDMDEIIIKNMVIPEEKKEYELDDAAAGEVVHDDEEVSETLYSYNKMTKEQHKQYVDIAKKFGW